MRTAALDVQHQLRRLHPGLCIEVDRRRPCEHLLPRVTQHVPHPTNAVGEHSVVPPKCQHIPRLHLTEGELEVVEDTGPGARRRITVPGIRARRLLYGDPYV